MLPDKGGYGLAMRAVGRAVQSFSGNWLRGSAPAETPCFEGETSMARVRTMQKGLHEGGCTTNTNTQTTETETTTPAPAPASNNQQYQMIQQLLGN